MRYTGCGSTATFGTFYLIFIIMQRPYQYGNPFPSGENPQQQYLDVISNMEIEERIRKLEGVAGFKPSPPGVNYRAYYGNDVYVKNINSVTDKVRRLTRRIEALENNVSDNFQSLESYVTRLNNKLMNIATKDKSKVNKELLLKDKGIGKIVGDHPSNLIRGFLSQSRRRKNRKTSKRSRSTRRKK